MRVDGVFLLLLLGLAVQVGCSSSSSPGKASVVVDCGGDGTTPYVEGIIAGQGLNKKSEFAKPIVLVAYPVTANGGKKLMSICTGSLIDKDTVLTAAHCVEEAPEKQDVRVLFTVDAICDVENSSLDTRRAVDVEINPEYLRDGFGDLALIRFSGGLPADRTVVSLANRAAMMPHSQILVVGFGNSKGYKVEDTSLRLRFGFVSPLSNRAVAEKLEGHLRNIKLIDTSDQKFLVFDQSNQNGVCAGDSGGPAFERQGNSWVQIGVASFVANPEGDSCGLISAHTNVARYIEWIRKKVPAHFSLSGAANGFDTLIHGKFPRQNSVVRSAFELGNGLQVRSDILANEGINAPGK